VLPEEILTPGPGQVRAVFTICGNPVSSTPDGSTLIDALKRLDLFVSLDLYVTESNRYADYILPAPTFLERPDIVLSFGGTMPRPWVQYTEPVIERIGDTREEWEVYQELLVRMGIDPGPNPWTVINQMIDDSERARAEGWTLDRIKQHPHGIELGGDVPVGVAKQRLAGYTGGERDRVDLGAGAVLDQLAALAATIVGGDELLLIGRRDLRSINSWMHNVRTPRANTTPALLIHPDDAAARGLHDGDLATVATKLGSVDLPVELTDAIHAGTVSYPHGWGHRGGWRTAVHHGGVNINLIIPNDLETKDPLSGMSLLDGVPVLVSKGT
jgi:formate dehydrogenase